MHQWSCSALSHSFQPHSSFFWRDFIKKQKTKPKIFLCHLNIKFSWVRFPLWNGELFSEWSLYFQLEKNHYLLCSSFIINFFPSYLKDITAGIRNSTFHINTRISSNHSLPRCRYEVFSKCFFFLTPFVSGIVWVLTQRKLPH